MKFGVALLALSVSLLALAPSWSQDGAPKFYPLNAGGKWYYQVTPPDDQPRFKMMTQITKIETIKQQQLSRLETINGKGEVVAFEHLGNVTNGLYRFRFNDIEATPGILLLKAIPKVGDTWYQETKVGEDELKLNCQVGSAEVTVPAGKFQALSLRIDTKSKDGAVIGTTYWFARNVGIIRQVVEFNGKKTILDLEKYVPGN